MDYESRNQMVMNEKTNVMKQRHLVNTEDDYCYVCGGEDTEDKNKIVYCEGCNITVHQKCYGMNELEEGEDWFCLNC